MDQGLIARWMVLVVPLGFCGCASADGFGSDLAEDELRFRDDGGRQTRDPGDGGNWLGNGLNDPTASHVDPQFGLGTPEGLAEHPDLVDHPDYLKTAEYLVECALGPQQSLTKVVDGVTIELHGLVGLAPEWESGECDQDCQEWVTACLLARTNVSGQEVTVAIRSDHDDVGTKPTQGYPKYEASWFGNLFVEDPVMYFCEGNGGGLIAAQRQDRTCSTGEDCGFVDLGSCYSPGRCDVQQGTRVECMANGKAYHTLSTYLANP